MKLKLKNIHLILFLLAIVFACSLYSLQYSEPFEQLYKVEGLTNETVNVNFNNNLSKNKDKKLNTSEFKNSASSKSSNTTYSPNTFTSSQIPKGDEDLYILKSEVVPPVCPACPTVAACPRQEPPPPCPPCARCPEPAFDCKKVPNYSSNNVSKYVPRPVLADFSQFGM